jgi:hypothetical protein
VSSVKAPDRFFSGKEREITIRSERMIMLESARDSSASGQKGFIALDYRALSKFWPQ